MTFCSRYWPPWPSCLMNLNVCSSRNYVLNYWSSECLQSQYCYCQGFSLPELMTSNVHSPMKLYGYSVNPMTFQRGTYIETYNETLLGVNGVWTHDLRFTRPTPYHLATTPQKLPKPILKKSLTFHFLVYWGSVCLPSQYCYCKSIPMLELKKTNVHPTM